MKFQNNNKKPTFAFLTLLSSCAIALYIEAIPSKLLSKNQSFDPAIEQQLKNQTSQNPIDHLGKGNDEVVEEIKLDKEWEGILGSEPEQEVLLARGV
ncbi:MAG: hypothetical protein QNJ53_00725 [Pleurocapsa sp. MO_192.B19]|nr:hypothetical protein [Pleurocapsa sp. MO_192.B19]